MLKDVLETGINQLSHPNPHVRARLVEHSISECPNGCKYYQDPKTKQIVLHHNPSYGCSKTRRVIEREQNPDHFQGLNYWMVPVKDRLDPDHVDALMSTTLVRSVERNAGKMIEGTKKLASAAQDATKAVREFGEAAKPKPSPRRLFRKRGRDRD